MQKRSMRAMFAAALAVALMLLGAAPALVEGLKTAVGADPAAVEAAERGGTSALPRAKAAK